VACAVSHYDGGEESNGANVDLLLITWREQGKKCDGAASAICAALLDHGELLIE
jgi:hypothetical protein